MSDESRQAELLRGYKELTFDELKVLFIQSYQLVTGLVVFKPELRNTSAFLDYQRDVARALVGSAIVGNLTLHEVVRALVKAENVHQAFMRL